MARCVVVDDSGQHEDRQRVIEPVQRVVRMVEEQDVTETEHHSRHAHRYRSEQANQLPHAIHPRRLFEEIRAAEDEHRSEYRGRGRHLDAVPEGNDDAGVDQAERVMPQREMKILRPQLDERRVNGHSQHGEEQKRHDDTECQHRRVEPALRLWRIGDCPR